MRCPNITKAILGLETSFKAMNLLADYYLLLSMLPQLSGGATQFGIVIKPLI